MERTVKQLFNKESSKGFTLILNPKPHFPSVHSCVILSKNSSINYLKSSEVIAKLPN